MELQYYVLRNGERIPVYISEASDKDIAATENSWQTDWNSEYLSDPALEKYAAKLRTVNLLHLVHTKM